MDFGLDRFCCTIVWCGPVWNDPMFQKIVRSTLLCRLVWVALRATRTPGRTYVFFTRFHVFLCCFGRLVWFARFSSWLFWSSFLFLASKLNSNNGLCWYTRQAGSRGECFAHPFGMSPRVPQVSFVQVLVIRFGMETNFFTNTYFCKVAWRPQASIVPRSQLFFGPVQTFCSAYGSSWGLACA